MNRLRPTSLDEAPRALALGPLAVLADGSSAQFLAVELALTRAQRLVLAALLRRGGRVARRWELYEEAFGRPLPAGSRAVDVHVQRIRRALGPAGACILTVGRVGYRLDPAVLCSVPAKLGDDSAETVR